MRRSLPTLLLSAAAGALLSASALRAQDQPPPAPSPEAPRPSPSPASPEPGPDASPKPAKPGDEEAALRGVPFFPLDQGRRWVYRLTYSIRPAHGEGEEPKEGEKPGGEGAPLAERRLDAYVSTPQTIGEQRVAVLEWKLDEELAQRSYYRVDGGVLRCLRRLQERAENVKEFSFTPAQTVCPTELKVGATWTWEGKNGAEKGKQVYTVLRQEKVQTRAGTFEAFVVEARYEGENDSGTQTRWLVKGVGIVKEVTVVKTPLHVIRAEGSLVKLEGKR
ncbi:MAG: hypothetical protein AB7N76_32125 [Planctomycetota bacterium]